MAASLVGVEAAVFLLLGLLQVSNLEGEKLMLGLTTSAFFWLYGGFLAWCAWQLYRLHSWARAPVVLAQLIQILVGGSFWGGSTTVVSVMLVVVGLIALAGVFHPASLSALETGQ